MSRLVILVCHQSLPSGLSGMLDILTLSRSAIVQRSLDGNVCWQPEVLIASQDGAPVVDGHGRSIEPHCALTDISHCDAVLIPGFLPDTQGLTPCQITSDQTRQWFQKQYKNGALMLSSCSGAFVLGEARLLEGRACTATWWLFDELKSRFPTAQAQWGSTLVEDGQIVTAGGPMSWIEISLYAIRHFAGQALANMCADFAVVDSSPKSQALYSHPATLFSEQSFITQAQFQIRAHLPQHISASELAQALSVSERTLHRKIKQEAGQSPKTFIESVLINYASHLLKTSADSISQIAYQLGYNDLSVFRRQFKKITNKTPSEFRQWIQTR